MAVKNPAPYRDFQQPYTRTSRVKSKAYIKTVPPKAVVKYCMGNSRKWNDNQFMYKAEVIAESSAQISDVAIEASRQQLLREITNQVGLDFFMGVSVAPHQIIREHKQAAVAQADRMSQGMALSFGRTCGRMARVPEGKSIFTFGLNTEEDVAKVRAIYKITRAKLPIVTRFEVTKIF